MPAMRLFNVPRRWVFFLPLALLGSRAPATLVLPQNIEDLESQAQLIFAGVCTTYTAVATAQGLPATLYTFKVIEAVKGNVKAGSEVQFRQFGGPIPGSRLAMKVSGVPHYVVGQEVLLFLNPPGSIGLTAPVGLSQGVFAIEQSRDGKRTIPLDAVRRTLLNRNLDLSKYQDRRRFTVAESLAVANPPERMDLESFCSLIRKMGNARRDADDR
ncbi:MAG: hypothetical protein N3D11_03430 [Candidatus Sumerlaeia bacterium]|nr:hypothetical protein [Candidatus Sumerlaeia bacterium]